MSRETSTLKTRAVGLLLLFSLCAAQAPAQTAAQDEDVVTIRSQLVNIDAVVKDGKGKYVTDLKAEDFAVVENGVPQKVVFFDPPLARGGEDVVTGQTGE